MAENRVISPIREFAVNVENISFRLLIDRQHENGSSENASFFLHNHVSAELFSCLSGTVTLATEEGRLILRDGDMAVVPPGVPHRMLSSEENTESAVISFICERRTDRGISDDLYATLSVYVCSDSVLLYRDRKDICEDIADMVHEGQEEGGIAPALRALELLIRVAELPAEGNHDAVDKRSESRYDIQRMMRLDTVIATSYMKKLSMKEIADELYISSRQLDRIVRKRYGKTLHKIIMETRLRSAERMLMTTNMTVQEIGSEVGFSSNAAFYREFSRFYGVTPAEYRKKARR